MVISVCSVSLWLTREPVIWLRDVSYAINYAPAKEGPLMELWRAEPCLQGSELQLAGG
jgi:hypothetical protein